ncbi:unnamed protein product [Alternaria alternata]
MTEFPPPPTSAVPWEKMDLKFQEVNGHIEATHSKKTGEWTPLVFVPSPHVKIHGMSPALNYGQQVLEGLKAFRHPGSPGSISLFRPDMNAHRFQRSASALDLPIVPVDMFLQACRAAVALNAEFVPSHGFGGAMYVRPQLYGSSPQLGLTATDQTTFCVFVVPTGVHEKAQAMKALIVDDFDRAAPRGLVMLRLVEIMPLARHEDIDEFSTSAFIGARYASGADDEPGDEVTIVVSDSPCVIESVTCDTVQKIARSFGWTVEKRAISYKELPNFSEVMGAGTAVALMPIASITRKRMGEGLGPEPRVTVDGNFETIAYMPDQQQGGGPVHQKLLARLWDCQMGRVPDDFGWCFKVSLQDQEIKAGM